MVMLVVIVAGEMMVTMVMKLVVVRVVVTLNGDVGSDCSNSDGGDKVGGSSSGVTMVRHGDQCW